MGKPWGITRPLAEFSTISSQISDLVNKKNKIVERTCTDPKFVGSISEKGNALPTIPLQAVRCRKCDGCMKMREAQWAFRAQIEFLLAERTWWLTLTYRGTIEPNYEHVKGFFKRIRKAGHEIRYVISEERGTEKERLHWHILIHCSDTLKRRQIERCWDHGFVNARLARHAGLGRYLAKYLAKQSRIRASKHYGGTETILQHLSQRTRDDIEFYVKTGHQNDSISGTGFTTNRYDPNGFSISWQTLSAILEREKALERANSLCDAESIPW